MMSAKRMMMNLGFGAVAMWLGISAMPFQAHAEKCDPKNPSVCVGGPTGQPCGKQGQICCGINGYDYDCVSDDDACVSSGYTCEPYYHACTALCFVGSYQYQVSYSAVQSLEASEASIVCGGRTITYNCN